MHLINTAHLLILILEIMHKCLKLWEKSWNFCTNPGFTTFDIFWNMKCWYCVFFTDRWVEDTLLLMDYSIFLYDQIFYCYEFAVTLRLLFSFCI